MKQGLQDLKKSVRKSFTKVPKNKVDNLGQTSGPDPIYVERISPYIAYTFLKAHFGRPQWVIHSYADYDKIQWTFYLKGRHCYLEIYDWKLINLNIRIETDRTSIANYQREMMKDVKLLLSYISRYAKLKGPIPLQELRYEMIANVYRQNYTRAKYSLDQSDPEVDEESVRNWASALFYSFTIDSLLNIIYEIYLDPNIKGNKALREEIERMSPKEKWCLGSYFCSCFRKPLPKDSTGYGKLSNLWDLRTKWVHGKITDEMRLYFLRRDGLGFATSRDPLKYHTWYNFDDYPDASTLKNDVDCILSELLNAMKPQVRRTFARKLEQGDVTFDTVNRRLAGPQHDFWA